MKRLNLVGMLLCVSLFRVVAVAQDTGKMSGTVTDASTGEPIVGATVLVEGTRLGAATDVEGNFLIMKVPSGVYSVAATYMGYRKTVTKDVQVLNDLTTKIDFRLAQSTITMNDEIVVYAEAPMVRKDLTSTERRVTSEEIKVLPLQDLNELITLQAGVTKDAGGGLHIRGGRSTEISYLLNGISITDDYTRTQALTVETESVQELQVISGTFNAEYGNAMSGVVNVVTKTGGSTTRGTLEMWTGDYVSNHEDIFWGINEFNPLANYNLQATLGGPLVADRLTYFAALRRTYNDGYLYGVNQYSPQGRTIPGDGSFVSMSSSSRWSGQATIEWTPSPAVKLKTDVFGSTEKNKFYSHFYRLNPNGEKGGVSKGGSIFEKLTHQLFSSTFHELTLAYKYNRYESNLYDDPYDPRYTHPDSLLAPGYHFAVAGTDLNRFQRSTKSFIARWDITSQLDRIHLMKAGAEIQYDRVFFENINLVPATGPGGQELTPFVPYISGTDSPNHDMFERTPFKLAVYVQDKIELESMIINFGLRYELFNPRGNVPVDAQDPNIYNPYKVEHIYRDANGDGRIDLSEQTDANKLTVQEREAFWYRPTTVKQQLSPRLGIAYPITDKGVIRFSYGLFQQIPEYSQLYQGDQFKLTSTQGLQGPFGNNDLKPQRTANYELGLQQQLTPDVAVDVTMFYRDIRDWISSSPPIPTFLAGVSYSQRINRDLANVKGITLTFNKRYSHYFSLSIDYTFQVADGTNSTSDEQFYALVNGAEPKVVLTPLDWDQTHTLNARLFVGDDVWGGSLVGNASTGQPYTPQIVAGAYTGRNIVSGLADNSRRKPFIVTLNLELYRNFKLGDVNLQVFARAFNLLDSKNPTTVYTDTGKPDFTLVQEQVTSYDPGWFTIPTYYSEPRSFYIGTMISL